MLLLGSCRGARGEPSSDPIDTSAAPEQLPLTGDEASAPPLSEGVSFTPQARYRVAARVLSRERYYLGWRAELSPVDLALGWGPLSDPQVDTWIDWYQRGRWYFWQWSAGSPYENEAIRTQSANVHMIPATKNLRRALLALDSNERIRLTGLLVNVMGGEGETWNTSLSREDTGDQSCEILYVTELATERWVYH